MDKSWLKMPKMVKFGEFKAALPDRWILRGQNLMEMPKLKNSNATFPVIFKQCEATVTVPQIVAEKLEEF